MKAHSSNASSKVEVEQNLGGDWDSRKPSKMRTFKALLKRSILLKIRDVGAIISEIVAILIFIVFGIIYEISFSRDEAIGDDPLVQDTEQFGSISLNFAMIQSMGEDYCYIGLPDNEQMHTAMQNYFSVNPIFTQTMQMINLADLFEYCNTVDELKNIFTTTNAIGVGIGIPNLGQENWFHDTTVNLFQGADLFSFYAEEIRAASMEIFRANGEALLQVYRDFATENSVSFDDFPVDAESFQFPNITFKRMPKPEIETALAINTIAVFLSAIPIIIASMPDLSIILSDKESHVMTYIFLMGAPEYIYWLVNFLSSFVMCLVPYIVVTILFCTWCGLQGTNYVLLLILTILFIIAYICFQFFISTFFQTQSAGRVLTVIFLIAVLFFGFLNYMYALDGEEAVKHVLSIFPLEPFEMIIHVMYEEVRNGRGGLGFGDFTKDLKYPVYYCFVWEIVDIILWGALFLLCNATLDRGFGSPPYKFKDLIRCNFKKQKKLDLEDLLDGDSVMNVEHLTKRYKGSKVNAIDDVSFDIKKGEIIVMIGPNGAGKSSIINTVSGAIPVTKGTLSLGGNEKMDQFTGIQECLGIVFQDNVIMRVLSIREHLELFGAIRGIDENTLKSSIEYFAEMLQLTEMLPNRAGDLSGGQKRKLCIAMALLGNPPIIIMDEPTAGVDVQARQLIWKSISGLKNSTCIITTHALEEAEAVSSRMFVVSNGKLPFVGTSTELRNKFKCGYLLKCDCEPEQMPDIVNEIKKFIPEASMAPERDDTITMPVSEKIPDMLKSLFEKKEQLGLEDFSFAVEQLEDVLSRLLESNEFYIPQ